MNIYKQPISEFLNSLNISCEYFDRIPSPLYEAESSDAFVVRGLYWHDYRIDKGGDAGDLASLLFPNDVEKALKTLYACAGLDFIPNIKDEKQYNSKRMVKTALLKVKDAFKVDIYSYSVAAKYLRSRMVTAKSSYLFSFIPAGELKSVLNEEEIELTGLAKHEEKIILWYLVSGAPEYYCTRNIETKEFRKAPMYTGDLTHPIWNQDALYTSPIVVWSEGMFDSSSLIELGYGAAGEITCNLIRGHYSHLIEALRWRALNHSDWRFIICLDNDIVNSQGKRSGNVAAEKLARMLWTSGCINCEWVKHDETEAGKIDINKLHQEGRDEEIRKMISSAKPIFEQLGSSDESCYRNMAITLTNGDLKSCDSLCNELLTRNSGLVVKDIIKKLMCERRPWQDVYNNQIEEIFLHGPIVSVYYSKNIYNSKSGFSYDEFQKSDLIKNLYIYQKNKSEFVKYENLIIPKKLKEWRITTERNNINKFNLYHPTEYLLQKREEGVELPKCWDELFDNICSTEEKKWLLNHMATYVQTLKKPFVIPVILGEVGTGKTSLFKLFGKALGAFRSVSNSELESDFNSYLLTPVLLLDELSCSKGDTIKIKNKLKMLINEHQLINIKYREPMDGEINNYIAICSNEFKTSIPLVIEKSDRRYSVISGGKNERYEDRSKYDEWEKTLKQFILYLLSCPIDEKAAYIPIETQQKIEVQEQSKPYNLSIIEDFIIRYTNKDLPLVVLKDEENFSYNERIKVSKICDFVNAMGKMNFKLTGKTIVPYLSELGIKPVKYQGQNVVLLPSLHEETESQSSLVINEAHIIEPLLETKTDLF